ncbi:hypothetical protein [Bacillus phage SBSphiJ7]|nr:hypothetical protein [Bacillus phage SBSphiJ7]
MEKVKLTRQLADLLEAQLAEVSIHINSKDHEDISHFLITTMFSYEQRPKRYDKLFSGAYTDLLSNLGDMKYIDALRVGYEIETTLEEEYTEAWERQAEHFQKKLKQEATLPNSKEYWYYKGRRDEALESLETFKTYLKQKDERESSE